MAACRRSARLAPQASRKSIIPTDILISNHPQSNTFTGESLVASIKSEPDTSPYQVRDCSNRISKPKAGSKRKLNFERGEVSQLNSSVPRSSVKLENMSNFSVPLQVVVKQEEGQNGENVNGKPLKASNSRGRRDTKVEASVPLRVVVKQEEGQELIEVTGRPLNALNPRSNRLGAELLEDFEAKKVPKRAARRAGRFVKKERERVTPTSKKAVRQVKKVLKREREDVEGAGINQEVSSVVRDGAGKEVAVLATGPAIAGTSAMELAIVSEGPYPTFARPFPDECYEVRNRLAALHGVGESSLPKSCPSIEPVASREPAEAWVSSDTSLQIASTSTAIVLSLECRADEDLGLEVEEGHKASSLDLELQENETKVRILSASPSERRTVLDSLLGTILSQNTTDKNSRRAFTSLKTAFPTWEQVHKADPKAVEDAIRCGGLAETKTNRIMNILDTIFKERGTICLEYIRHMTVDQIKAELSRFKGVGPKTVACVLMFHLERNEFPVDTHVFRLSKMLGWVPANADREKTYLHMNSKVPNEIKFDLHCLLVTHGKRCPHCAKRGRAQTAPDGPCPLVNWSPKLALRNGGDMELLEES